MKAEIISIGAGGHTHLSAGGRVGIAVLVHVRARVERVLDERIGAHEAADGRVVDAAVHVDEADLLQVLVAGEAAAGLRDPPIAAIGG